MGAVAIFLLLLYYYIFAIFLLLLYESHSIVKSPTLTVLIRKY